MAAPVLMTLRGLRTGPQTVGDMLRFGVTFSNTAGEEVDPTTVRFEYIPPSDRVPTTLTYNATPPSGVTKVDTGNYRVDLPLDEPGSWAIRWESEGNYIGATEFTIPVAQSKF